MVCHIFTIEDGKVSAIRTYGIATRTVSRPAKTANAGALVSPFDSARSCRRSALAHTRHFAAQAWPGAVADPAGTSDCLHLNDGDQMFQASEVFTIAGVEPGAVRMSSSRDE